MSVAAAFAAGSGRLTVAAISFDFGNTLVRVDRPGLRSVVELTADRVMARCRLRDRAAFLAAWDEERERQFREEVPAGREVDLRQRVVRVVARARGMTPPSLIERWDDARAATFLDPEEVAFAVDAYARAFSERIPVDRRIDPFLARLRRRGFRLGIVSNWPLAASIDRFCAVAGWTPLLDAIVISERVGSIKPDGRIFAEAALALDTLPGEIVHVGDDWAADVVGARRAGWRAAYLVDHQGDSPLPSSERGAGPASDRGPDLELLRLADLEGRVALTAR